MYKICKYGEVNKYVVSVNIVNDVTSIIYSSNFKDGANFRLHEADRLCEELNEIYSNYGVVFGGYE